jgi:hypothetical protein
MLFVQLRIALLAAAGECHRHGDLLSRRWPYCSSMFCSWLTGSRANTRIGQRRQNMVVEGGAGPRSGL